MQRDAPIALLEPSAKYPTVIFMFVKPITRQLKKLSNSWSIIVDIIKQNDATVQSCVKVHYQLSPDCIVFFH